METLEDLPYWTNRVPDVATFAFCDDHIDEALALELFGKHLQRFRHGIVRDHARIFNYASWLTAAAGEGCLMTGEVAVPVLVPRSGAVTHGVAIIDVSSDDSSWARFCLGEPGFQFKEIPFETETGEHGFAVARLKHESDEASRLQEGGEDDWFMSLWGSDLWFDSPFLDSALPAHSSCDNLQGMPELVNVALPGTKLVCCDGCDLKFESAHAWQSHVEAGCPESMFFPTEVVATRPEPLRLAKEFARHVFPAPGLVRRLLLAAGHLGNSILDAVLDGSFLMDGRTSLRDYMHTNATFATFALPQLAEASALGAAVDPISSNGCQKKWPRRWEFCPLLQAGPLAIYRGSEDRPHAIRRALLQQGFNPFDAVAAMDAGCHTLEQAVEWMANKRRAAWSNPPRCGIQDDQTSRVGVVFDTRLDKHFCTWGQERPNAAVMRLEGPQRTHTAFEHLSRAGLLRHCSIHKPRAATNAELVAVHTPAHLAALVEAVNENHQGDDYYVNHHTNDVAILCAGAHAAMAQQVALRKLDVALCITRPPGHHAGEICGQFRGGCFLNNAAIAASAARMSGSVERVLILDWDVHHGDGTQSIFYDDPNVLTISIHRFEHEPGGFYPSDGLPSHCGIGKGLGLNVNVACVFTNAGYGDADYGVMFEHLILPIAKEFAPDLAIIAAGFDSARGDPIGGFDLTGEGYAAMVEGILSIPSLRGQGLIVSLEGGYNPSSTAEGLEACLQVMLHRRPQGNSFHVSRVKPETAISLAAALQCQARFWPCLAGWEELVVSGVRLGDLSFPKALECETHSPCWCCKFSASLE